MTSTEFAAWIKGISLVLNGHPPPVEIWTEILDEAAKLGQIHPPLPKIVEPLPGIIEPMRSDYANSWPETRAALGLASSEVPL